MWLFTRGYKVISSITRKHLPKIFGASPADCGRVRETHPVVPPDFWNHILYRTLRIGLGSKLKTLGDQRFWMILVYF